MIIDFQSRIAIYSIILGALLLVAVCLAVHFGPGEQRRRRR